MAEEEANCSSDGEYIESLLDFLDQKVPSNANPVDEVFSFDVIMDRENESPHLNLPSC